MPQFVDGILGERATAQPRIASALSADGPTDCAAWPPPDNRDVEIAKSSATRSAFASSFDARARHRLETDLRSAIAGEVRFDDGSRALYSTDASNYRQVPVGVVLPKSVDEVVAAMAVCRRHGAPVLARGGGTSLAGQGCNVAVVFDYSKYLHRVLSIDPERRSARVEPGCVLDDLRHAAEQHRLTFGPDPSTHNRCTLGGMIGNNSCGVHSVMAGRTVDNVDSLDVLTYDGVRMRVGPTSPDDLHRLYATGGRVAEIYRGLESLVTRYGALIRERFPNIPRRVSGYSLDELLPEHGFNLARALVGTEGTCVSVLEATVRLVPSPPARTLVVLGYPDVAAAADHILDVMQFHPIGCEGFDDALLHDLRKKGMHREELALLPDGGGFLLVEFGGETRAEADARADDLVSHLAAKRNSPSVRRFDDPDEEQRLWRVRESGLGATARVPGQKRDSWEGWEDSAVPPARVGDYLRSLRDLFGRFGYRGALYGHFGQGCVHTRIDFDLRTHEGIVNYRAFVEAAADLVVHYGGSLSGEHGDGQSRAELLPKMFGEELVQAFREFKRIWDPDGKMNPGKKVDPYRLDQNLRFGTHYQPLPLATRFAFADDDHSFARATERCVGVGECRRLEGGTMCPSYRVTREERHSTRGRAHLLFELLQGDPLDRKWREEPVREALDLCLSCKGCKSDCPMNVDMATYKAEFLAHYYKRRLRPPSAYAMGLIDRWARIAAHVPGVANFFLGAPGLSHAIKWVGGVAQRREIPRFAEQTFQRAFRRRPIQNEGHRRVMLWADTFNDHFHPGTALAAVEVLEAAGYQVVVPGPGLCCGRPLYDYGMLDRAHTLLERVLTTLRDEIRAGVPLVGLEPSCLAVFRDELSNLFPKNEDAARLRSQSFLLSEFLVEHAHYHPPKLDAAALVHGHCHHKSVMGFDAERTLLERSGLSCEILDSGCCGMAGAFGFERSHYAIAMAAGERVLLPRVRQAPAETMIVANGFSCREQIRQATDRRALHLAEVLKLAIDGSRSGGSRGGAPRNKTPYPERLVPETATAQPQAWMALLPIAVLLASIALYLAAQ